MLTIEITMDEPGKNVTALDLAHEIVKLSEEGVINPKDLRELVAYLSVYNDYNMAAERIGELYAHM